MYVGKSGSSTVSQDDTQTMFSTSVGVYRGQKQTPIVSHSFQNQEVLVFTFKSSDMYF